MPREIRPFTFSGAAMRHARKRAGLSLWQLAAKMAQAGHVVSSQSLRNWEIGKGEPRGSDLFAIARCLNAAPQYLVREAKELES